MTENVSTLVLKIRPFFGHIVPPDHDIRICTITGVDREGRSQTFFTALLDQPIRFGDLGAFERVVVWARGPDFIHRDGNGFEFAPTRKSYGYISIDRAECTTERHRHATIEAEFTDAAGRFD